MGSKRNIVVWGESGEGKSTLINNIVGKDVALTGKEPGGVTKDLKGHESSIGTLWDLPGAGDKDIPPYMSLQFLEKTFTGSRKIDGLLILSKNPNRIHIGAQLVMKLMDLSFSSEDKWNSVALVGTFSDKWDEGDEENFRTKVLESFNAEVGGSISSVACVNKKDFNEVVDLIEGMAGGGMGDFSMPDPRSIADVVVKTTGIDPKDAAAETQKIIDALKENNERLTEALGDLQAKGGSTESFKGLHLGPLGKVGFSW